MSVDELRVRSRQHLAQLYESVFRSGGREISDYALIDEIHPQFRAGSIEDATHHILQRIRNATDQTERSSPAQPFFPSLFQRGEIANLMSSRFAQAGRAIIDRAERAMAGRFDLLGFTDLSFGDPIDWHLEPVSVKRAPMAHWSKVPFLDPDVAGDKKITWELNRHSHFITLGQAYWLTGDERYAEGFVSQASSWMDANPPNLGINWVSSLELAFRSIAWLWALYLFAGSRHLTSKFVPRLLKYLVMHGRHIEAHLSYYFSPNTHLTGEAMGLFYLGTALPELRRAQRWRDKGLQILLDQMPLQVRSDGVYFEQSSYYHRYTADFYLHLYALARAIGLSLPREIEERLALMLDHLMWITRPDGTSPLIGDDDGGRLIALGERRADDFRDTLAAGATLFERADWKMVAGDAPVELLWLLGPAALANYDAIEPRLPEEETRSFRKGGYYVMRDGWAEDSSYALIDCGPHGALSSGHAHSDSLAIEFAAGGKTWLVDPGTFTYTGNAQLRDEFRSTEGHNTVTVDGQPQSIPSGPFRWNRIAESRLCYFTAGESVDYFKGSHDGYERLADPVTHTRKVLLLKSGFKKRKSAHQPASLLVQDSFTALKHHQYALRYHLSPDCSARLCDNRVIVAEPGGRELTIRFFGRTANQIRIEEGWVSRCYGHREEAPVVVFEAEGEGPQEFITLIIPSGRKGF